MAILETFWDGTQAIPNNSAGIPGAAGAPGTGTVNSVNGVGADGGGNVPLVSANIPDFQQSAREAMEYATGTPVQTLADLRAVAPARRQDKQERFVEDLNFIYAFNAEGTGADDNNLIIAPTTGTGRWFKTGAGSLTNADTLQGQNGAYYRDYNNLTNKPSIPSPDGSGKTIRSLQGLTSLTLTAAESANGNMEFIDAPAGVVTVSLFDNTRRTFRVYNNTPGIYSLIIKTPSGTGTDVPKNSYGRSLECDGTNVVVASGSANELQGTTVSSTAPTSGQVLGYNGTQAAWTTPSGGGGGGNSTVSMNVSSTASPYVLSAAQQTATTLIFTGTRTALLEISSPVAGSWIIENRSGQQIRFLAAAGSTKKAPIGNTETRIASTDLTNVALSAAFAIFGGVPSGNFAMFLQHDTGISSGGWTDQSGSGNAATAVNGAAPGSTGGINGFTFDGINDQLTIPSNLGVSGTGNGITLFARANFTGSNRGSLIAIGGNNGNGIKMACGSGGDPNSNGNQIVPVHSGVSTYIGPTIGTGLHSIALVYPPGNTTSVRVFVDGVFISTLTTGQIVAPSAQTTIGGHTEGSTNLYFSSTIVDAAVYSRNLSDAEVLQLHNNL